MDNHIEHQLPNCIKWILPPLDILNLLIGNNELFIDMLANK